jgi:TolB-like protein/Tfp pilus assembly protein PilF
VAILPFTDMSQEQDQAYFCDGIAEEIINALCCVRGLRIASRTSSFQFKARAVDAREIGRQLNVGAVLEGSVRKAGKRVRITAQLLNASDGYHVWSQSYDRELDDVFAIQTDIAQRMVDALRVSLTPRENALIERGGTRNSQAYDFFLRGQQLLWAYGGAEEAPAMFRRAIEHDPAFAQAHAGLANSLAVRGVQAAVSPAEIEEASAAIRRALELEPWMPEAFLARACLASQQGRNEDADKDFEESIRLNPKSYFAYYAYGRQCKSTRRLEKAAELFRTSAKLAPDEYTPLGMLAMVLQQVGDKEQHREVLQTALHAIERHLQRTPDDEAALGRAGVIAASLGETARAERYRSGPGVRPLAPAGFRHRTGSTKRLPSRSRM